MAILPYQHKYILKSPLHASRTHLIHISGRVYCATTSPSKPKPSQTPLAVEPGRGPTPTPVQVTIKNGPRPDDPDLRSTWPHRAWVAGGCTTVLIALAKSLTAVVDSNVWAEPILAGLAGYFLADLGSGVYHWGVDNYGDATSPIVGAQIEAFQGHHKWPWTITRRQFANNLYALARVITLTVLPMDLVVHDPTLIAFIGSFSGCILFSQQFHAWAHTTKSKLPKIVVSLQDLGVLVSRSQHAAHHRPPYNNNYCIVSGVWNKFLDENKIFEVLEMMLFFQLGVRPRSWSEPSFDWSEENTTSSSLPQ